MHTACKPLASSYVHAVVVTLMQAQQPPAPPPAREPLERSHACAKVLFFLSSSSWVSGAKKKSTVFFFVFFFPPTLPGPCDIRPEGFLPPPPPCSCFSPQVAVWFGNVPTYFHEHIKTFFFSSPFRCSTVVECAATAVVGFFFPFIRPTPVFFALLSFFFFFLPQRFEACFWERVCVCFETFDIDGAGWLFSESFWRFDIVWDSNSDNFLYSGFNICWKVAGRSCCTLYFL